MSISLHDVRARQPAHEKIERDIAAFEARGGRIEVLAPGESSMANIYFGKVRLNQADADYDDAEE